MTRFRKIAGLCYVGMIVPWITNLASAQGIFVGVTSGYVPGTAPFMAIDPDSGEYSALSLSARAHNALAADSTGQLYASWFSSSGSNGRVSRIDPDTGFIEETFNAITPGAGDVRGLAFDALDTLYAVVNRNDASGSPTVNDDLYVFDLLTETTTVVGSLGFTAVQGLDFASNGNLYAWDIVDGLLIVDPLTGAATDVNPSIGGTVDIQSIAFRPDGRLFGARTSLYSIDVSTGAFSAIGPGGGPDIRGIEWRPVPEPTSGVIALLASAMLASRGVDRRCSN